MKTTDKIIKIVVAILILGAAAAAIISAVNGEYINAVIYAIEATLIVLAYGCSLVIEGLDIYHAEVRLLREDLAKLNTEISKAFENVDTNFNVLVHAIDDFVADLEEGDIE